MSTGFYAGSFDPFTNGHLFVLKNACKIFDEVIVGIGNNKLKHRMFDNKLIKQAIINTLKSENITNAKVVVYGGLTIDAAIENNADYLIRGIRNGTDYEMEENLALINEELSGLQTIYFRAGKLGMVSASMVKELLVNNKDINAYVPQEVLKIIKNV